jgi:hypothetical protein
MAPVRPYSFQLYSSRNFPPLADQLGVLSALGYANVEPFGGLHCAYRGGNSGPPPPQPAPRS